MYALGPTTLKYGFSPRFVPWLRENASRYDAVIVNGIWQYHSFGTGRRCTRPTRRTFCSLTGCSIRGSRKQYPLKHLKKWMYWPWAEYRVLRDARAVLFTCEEERRLARTSFWLYRCNEVVVSYGTAKPKAIRTRNGGNSSHAIPNCAANGWRCSWAGSTPRKVAIW